MPQRETRKLLLSILNKLSAVNRVLETLLGYAAGALLICFTIIIFTDVVFRQALGSPLMWPSEWSLTTFVWSTMLAASVAASANRHFVVEILPTFGVFGETALSLFVVICGMVVAALMLWFGWFFAIAGTRQFTPMLGTPLIYTYLAFPVFGLLTMVFLSEHLLRILTGQPPRHLPEIDEMGGE